MTKCEICNQPSTNAAYDLKFVNDWTTGAKLFKSMGDPHFYCDEHRRDGAVIFRGDVVSQQQREEWERKG